MVRETADLLKGLGIPGERPLNNLHTNLKSARLFYFYFSSFYSTWLHHDLALTQHQWPCVLGVRDESSKPGAPTHTLHCFIHTLQDIRSWLLMQRQGSLLLRVCVFFDVMSPYSMWSARLIEILLYGYQLTSIVQSQRNHLNMTVLTVMLQLLLSGLKIHTLVNGERQFIFWSHFNCAMNNKCDVCQIKKTIVL